MTTTTATTGTDAYEGRHRDDSVEARVKGAFRDSLRRNSLVPEYVGKHRVGVLAEGAAA